MTDGRIIVARRKPRLVKHGDAWMCFGIGPERRWFWQRCELIARYGKTPQAAFNSWRQEYGHNVGAKLETTAPTQN